MRIGGMIAYRLWLFGLVASLSLGLRLVPAQESPTSPFGKPVGDFRLQDFQSQWHATADLTETKAIVVAFLGVECPLVNLYAPRLVELAEEFRSQGVVFLAVDPNRQDSVTELAHFAKLHSLSFPLLKDVGNVVADRFGAVRVPELVVLDRDRVIRYRGRVDDQYGFQSGVGYQRPKATRRDLAEALREMLDGKSVTVSETHTPGCRIGRVQTPDADSEVTYSNQVARILQNRCVECHRPGQIAPFALTDYQEVAGWAEMIDETVAARRMPPWHASPEHGDFANDRRLSDEDRATIQQWVAAGAPEGDPADLPAPVSYVEGWQLRQPPDQVFYMSGEPFVVPAQGQVEYQYFSVDPKFDREMWVKAAECLPGNRAVVHHIIVFVQEPGENKMKLADGIPASALLAGTAPGNPPTDLPEGMAMRIPAGSKLVFQMHYTANGSPQPDRSAIGLVYADPAEVHREVKTDLAINTLFEIPAGAANHPVESWKRIKEDTLLVALMPHLHLRGKAFYYELIHADGHKETLLDIPHYDFNWQNSYYLKTPKLLPKGSRMHCVAHFDNSADNWANPDPSRPVKWGDQTWEEMMIGWFIVSPDRDVAPGRIASGDARFIGSASSIAGASAVPTIGRGESLTRSAAEAPSQPETDPVALDRRDGGRELIRLFEHAAGE